MSDQKIALEGGPKVWNEPFPMWPSFEESTIQKAMEPLRIRNGKLSLRRPEGSQDRLFNGRLQNGTMDERPNNVLLRPSRLRRKTHPGVYRRLQEGRRAVYEVILCTANKLNFKEPQVEAGGNPPEHRNLRVPANTPYHPQVARRVVLGDAPRAAL